MLEKNTWSGRWNQVKGSVQKQWGKISKKELDVIAGDRKKLVGEIQAKYNLSEDEAETQVATWETGQNFNTRQ